LARRMILMLIVIGLVLAVLGFVKFRQIQQGITQAAAFQPPPEAVTTIIATQERWPSTLSAIGTIVAVQGVTVSADLPGLIDRIHFQSGDSATTGDLLVELDTRQEQAQLAAAQADHDLAQLNYDRLKGLVDQGAVTRAEYDQAAAVVKQTAAKIGEIQATIARKTIRAPFSGMLGLRQVNLGQYLSSGEAIVPLQSLDPIYVNFAVPQQNTAEVAVGHTVRVTAPAAQMALQGRVTAINSIVDEATRNIQIQATLSNPRGRLRPGMFVQAELRLGLTNPIVPLPASAISYAPYGDSVFIVTDMKDRNGQIYRGVRQQFVKLGLTRGDQIAVLLGVKPGEEVVSSGVFKLRNGAAVLVNNEVQPGNNPSPKPEEN
jgi:membrane fusion protein, multidrug efflux system